MYWFVCTFMSAIKAMAMQLYLGNFFENLAYKGGASAYNSAGPFCFLFLQLSYNKITKKEYLISIEIVRKI